MHLLIDFLSTRGRVITAALVVGCLQLAVLLISVPWIDHHSSSAGLNLILIVVFMLLSIFAGFFLALFIGDTVFDDEWRGQVFDAVAMKQSRAETDLYELSQKMRARTFQFSTFVVFGSVALVLLGNFASDNFFERYQKVGYYRTVFRGDNAKLKLSAMKQIALQYGSDLEARSQLLIPMLESKSPRIRRGAANALAKVTKQSARGVRILALSGEKVRTRWEYRVLTQMREELVPKLFDMLKNTDDESFKMGAWFAFAAAHPEKIEEYAVKRRQVISLDSAERMVINVVLGKVMNLASTPILMEEMEASRPERTRIAAIWAMAMILENYEDPGLHRKELDDQVEETLKRLAEIAEDGSLAIRCAAFEALLRARDARHDLMLFRALAEAPREAVCPSQAFKIPDATPITFVRESDLRFKILEVIASIALGNRRVSARLEQLLAEEDVYGNAFLERVAGVLRTVARAEGR